MVDHVIWFDASQVRDDRWYEIARLTRGGLWNEEFHYALKSADVIGAPAGCIGFRDRDLRKLPRVHRAMTIVAETAGRR